MSGLTIAELIERDKQPYCPPQPPCPVSSGFTEESLRQAIEDAKEVRAQALRNARKALEEAFRKEYGTTYDTPNLRR